MRKVIIQVERLSQGFERFQQAWETGAPQGEFITFEDVETLLKTLTSKRWELVSVLPKQGPMSIRALARALGRDVKNVHTDVQALKEIGLVTDHPTGICVSYDEIEAHLVLKSAA
ncbi:transcriptional regulator [Thermithiobacillus tepidarius DSM 3134]|uniref:HVO_A0114 family putative DNA-binding protein n=1 Tax=Thermithiobacillus tepidarius TaxID=929 RepID=UPI000411BC00|nr:transcriptional regulator [Thermithiobacillus tepidarius]